MVTESRQEAKVVDKSFKISLALKGFDGLFEVIGGVILYLLSPNTLSKFLVAITRKEILEDPKDFVANRVINFANSLSISTLNFTVFFLLLHGLVKLFLVWLLLAKRLWAYPTAIVIFGLFGIYQIYQYSHNHSLGLIFLTVLDLVVIILTWLELRNLKRKLI